MPASYPHRRCTCGFTRFRETRQRIVESTDCWMLFAVAGDGGFGATELGTFFGAGSGGEWGLFTGVYRATELLVTCENCARQRSSTMLGGITPMGVYREAETIVVVAADVTRPVTCFSLKLVGPGGEELLTQLSLLVGTPPPIFAEEPPTVAPSPPAGASIVDTMLAATIPDVPTTGEYVVYLVDRCGGYEVALTTLTLESTTMIFSPLHADIGGAPRAWLANQRVAQDSAQPASSTRLSIPFDKCSAVIEYDARSGQLPSDEGWTRQGSGPSSDWALVEGGALRVATTAPNDNYWEKTITPADPLSQVYAYASVLGDVGSGAIGEGLDVQGMYRTAVLAYEGVRLVCREKQVFYTKLDGSAEVQISTTTPPSEWLTMHGADRHSGDEVGGEQHAFGGASEVLAAGTYGATGVAGADELVARFGNTGGALSVTTLIREVVVSSPGRFIRARFVGIAPTSAPMLRLYVVSDANASATKKVRFKVRYGIGTGDVYGPLSSSVSATINMLLPNTVYEVPLTLSGLTANAPVWISIERDWAHSDDKLEATVHLLQATMRSS